MTMPIRPLQEFIKDDRRSPGSCSRGEEIAIYISTWVNTPVPWYSIVLGMLLYRRGYAVHFVWDDLPDSFQPADERQMLEIAEALMLLSRRGLRFYRVSEMPRVAPDAADLEEVLRLASLNAVWWHKTPVPEPGLHTRRYDCLKILLEGLPQILGYFSSASPHSFLLPGGIVANSGFFLHACKRNNVRVTTYDSGVSSISTGIDSVAAHLDDIPHVMFQLLEDKDVMAYARKVGEVELQKRFDGVDKYLFQPVRRSTDSGKQYDVLFPLNIENDSSALGKHVLFEDSLAWLEETVDFILAETQASVVVRQHPYEKRIPWRNDALVHRLVKRYAGSDRVTIFDCNASVNTYDLITASRVVLPFVSSIAVEAAIMGKTVISVAPAFYAGFSFSEMPASKNGYFETIRKALEEDVVPAPRAVDEAWLSYYLSQICGRIWTDFTPQPSDYALWEKRSLKDLEADPEVGAVLRCLGDGDYISMVQHERIQREGLERVYRGAKA
ncbi:MAG: hypothetical protein ACK5JO_09525 [Halodesulfovibrio sp.]